MKRAWMLCAVVLVAGGALAGARRAAGDSEESALLKADRDFSEATVSRRLEGFRSFLAANASTLRADKPVIAGKEALSATWQPLLANPALGISWSPLSASGSNRGDLGYTVGTYEITQSDDKGKHVVGTGKYLTVWRKQADGSWKVEFDTGVADSEPEPKK
jgi:ketosteroid isomerase-like protein